MNPIGAHIRSKFDLSDDYCLFGQQTTSSFHLHWLRHRSRHLDRADAGLAWRLTSLLENFIQHVDNFAGVGPLQLDKLAHHFRRSDVHLFDHTSKLSNDVGILRHQKTG